ncbi:hypothetical protein HOP50_20g86070 [Chloropicon primus]|uniref:Uncharacterized protein n=1 Tax=Chloropicon primus TaxID=1764295 RepID=A0A5B8N188_9CHLO|nr:hypothetical protein A3770_20p85740 [Chloropicon primus]UPR05257.1 hypothetical protein HOP50_20g86070 [Chloropicon primus]|eukprot:QDZ26056.1 hypothetical protein A3770_20p85740 [Chloropicon primus]
MQQQEQNPSPSSKQQQQQDQQRDQQRPRRPNERTRKRIQAMLDSESESSYEEESEEESYSGGEVVEDEFDDLGLTPREKSKSKPSPPSPLDDDLGGLTPREQSKSKSSSPSSPQTPSPSVQSKAARQRDDEDDEEKSILYCGRVLSPAASSSGEGKVTLVRYDPASRSWTVKVEKAGQSASKTMDWFDILKLVTSEDEENLPSQTGMLGSPGKVFKANNFVSEMVDLWSNNPNGNKEQQSCSPKESNQGSQELAANFGGGPFSSPIQQQATTSSSDQRFVMNLLSTPGSTEVTPESKPAEQQASGTPTADHRSGSPYKSIVIPRQILSSPMRRARRAASAVSLDSPLSAQKDKGLGIAVAKGVGLSNNSGSSPSSSFGLSAAKSSSARKKLKLTCDKELLENELCNLLINKKIIKHWREGNEWACKDVNGKALDAYRIAELEERLISTAREARHNFTGLEIDQISRRAHAEWRQLKEKQQFDQNVSPQRPLKGILKHYQVARPTPSANKKVTFLAELVEFGSPMKPMH